jgi:hypothetical protein
MAKRTLQYFFVTEEALSNKRRVQRRQTYLGADPPAIRSDGQVRHRVAPWHGGNGIHAAAFHLVGVSLSSGKTIGVSLF